MSQNEDLLDLVQSIAIADLAELMSPELDLTNSIRTMLHLWAGSEGVSPDSRGSDFQSGADARDLKFLEAFRGEGFSSPATGTDPGPDQWLFVHYALNKAVEAYSVRLIFQTAGAALFTNGAGYNAVSDTFGGGTEIDFSALEDLADSIGSDPYHVLQTWTLLFSVFDEVIGFANLSIQDIDDIDNILSMNAADLDLSFDLLANPTTDNSASYGDSGDNLLTGHLTGAPSGGLGYYGYGGNDVILGTTAQDYIYGGDDNDILVGAAYRDQPYGGAGND